MCYTCENCGFKKEAPADNLYELHVTVEIEESEIQRLKDACAELGIRCHVLHNITKDGRSLLDVMTGETIQTDNEDLPFIQLRQTAALLEHKYGFKVVRQKIETVLNNPLLETKYLTKPGYGEAHLTMKIHDEDDPDVKHILSLCHVSKNTKHPDEVILTHRVAVEQFDMHDWRTAVRCAWIINDLISPSILKPTKGYTIRKAIGEYCIYDSNLAHDDNWVR